MIFFHLQEHMLQAAVRQSKNESNDARMSEKTPPLRRSMRNKQTSVVDREDQSLSTSSSTREVQCNFPVLKLNV